MNNKLLQPGSTTRTLITKRPSNHKSCSSSHSPTKTCPRTLNDLTRLSHNSLIQVESNRKYSYSTIYLKSIKITNRFSMEKFMNLVKVTSNIQIRLRISLISKRPSDCKRTSIWQLLALILYKTKWSKIRRSEKKLVRPTDH